MLIVCTMLFISFSSISSVLVVSSVSPVFLSISDMGLFLK